MTGKKSKYEELKNKLHNAEQPNMKTFLRTKIEKTRKLNLKKINHIKVKKVVQ